MTLLEVAILCARSLHSGELTLPKGNWTMSVVGRVLRRGRKGIRTLLVRRSVRGLAGEQEPASVAGEKMPRRSALLLTAGLAAALTGYSRSRTVKTDQYSDSLQSAVNACAPGDVLEVSKIWRIGAPVLLDKPLMVSATDDGRVITLGDHHAFDVAADNVWFDRLRIIGQGAGSAGVQAAIHAKGSLERPLRSLRVANCYISGFSKYGIEGWHLQSFVIERNRIEDISYGAVMILPGRDGLIERNLICNVTQSDGFTNSYGIALTHDSADSDLDSPRSESIAVRCNRIEGVTQWEGIDTHGGRDILVEGNEVLNCRVGIALVPGEIANGDARAPRDFQVLSNTVRSSVTDGSRSHGIQVAGVLQEEPGSGRVIEYATGTVEGSTIVGHGSAKIANSGEVSCETHGWSTNQRSTAGKTYMSERETSPNGWAPLPPLAQHGEASSCAS